MTSLISRTDSSCDLKSNLVPVLERVNLLAMFVIQWFAAATHFSDSPRTSNDRAVRVDPR